MKNSNYTIIYLDVIALKYARGSYNHIETETAVTKGLTTSKYHIIHLLYNYIYFIYFNHYIC